MSWTFWPPPASGSDAPSAFRRGIAAASSGIRRSCASLAIASFSRNKTLETRAWRKPLPSADRGLASNSKNWACTRSMMSSPSFG